MSTNNIEAKRHMRELLLTTMEQLRQARHLLALSGRKQKYIDEVDKVAERIHALLDDL